MRKHVEHRVWKPPENAIRGGFTGAARYHSSTYQLMDCGYQGNDHCNNGSRAAKEPFNICPNPEIRDLCTVCGANELMAHVCPFYCQNENTHTHSKREKRKCSWQNGVKRKAGTCLFILPFHRSQASLLNALKKKKITVPVQLFMLLFH